MARLTQSALKGRVHLAQGLLAFILVAGAAVVGHLIVAGPLFAHSIEVNLDLPDAAGLHPRSDVSYRGQHVGSVTGIDLTADGLRAKLKLDGGVRIPSDTDVVVADLSAVGEQYVDFRPRTASGPYLANGSTVIAGPSDLPLPTWQLLTHANSLLAQIKTSDVETIGREVQAIFGGGGVDLDTLVTEVHATLGMVQQLTPTTLALLQDAHTPLGTFANLSPSVVTLMRNSRAITAQLRKSNPTIAKLIDQGNVLVPVIDQDFHSVSPVLVKLLDDGTPVAAMARSHIPGLEHWFQWGPGQLQAMAAAERDNSAHVILVITPARNCTYGQPVSPFDQNPPLPLAARCTTVDPHVQQRGSQYVPVQ